MKTLRHVFGLGALCVSLIAAPAYALGGGGGGGGGNSGGHGAPSEPAPEESLGRSLTHATSYVRMEPVRTSVQADYRMRGLLQVGLALDAPHSRTRQVIAERQIWLRDAYSQAMLLYSGRMYRWGQIPDADVIARLLQDETDRVIGPGQATVVLDTVIIHAT
jgi:hypothetical protein